MTTGEGLLIAGVTGLGVFAYLKFRNQQTASRPPVTAPPVLRAQVSLAGAPPVLAALQPAASNAVHNLNKALGLNPGIQASWVRNPDGTYTDGSGCKITIAPDGKTYNRDCSQSTWLERHTPAPVKTAQAAVSNLGTGIVHNVESWFS